jgi:type II secretory ATPase GspE/PulE/Tfp pilus assembly ATPase PilB-like protein
VRKICSHCKEVTAISDDERDLLRRYTDDIPAKVGHAVGCQNCDYTGYRGRVGIYEVIEFDPETAEMVRAGVSVQEIRSRLSTRGHWSMGDHALSKVRGLTLTVRDVCEQVLTRDSGSGERRADAEAEQPTMTCRTK